MSRVFCVGLPKSGTQSLVKALSTLGYRTPDTAQQVNRAANDLSHSIFSEYDVFFGEVVAKKFKELDAKYPGSLFVSPVRNVEDVLTSRVAHQLFVRMIRQENPDINTVWWRKMYETHLQDLRSYFQGKNSYLELNISSGEGWEKLCPFLGKPVPEDQPFPYINVGAVRIRKIYETWLQRQ